MKALSKEQKQQHAAHVEALKTKRAGAIEAVAAYNDAVRAAYEALTEALKEYNDEVEASKEFVDNVLSEISDFRSEKTEKWEETNGDRYSEWESELEAVSYELETIDVDEPSEVEIEEDPACDFVDAFPFAVGAKE